MNEKEKEAMKYFYNLRATIDESNMLFDEDINVKCGKETIEKITTILNLIEKQQAEIEKYKMLLSEANVQFLNSNLETKRKNEEDLEMLYEGCQEELEKKDKIIDYMAEEIASYNHYEALGKLEDKDCVKQYFNQKIEKGE